MPRGPFLAALILIASLMLNVLVMGWPHAGLIFVDLSHPAEYRVSTAATVVFFGTMLLIYAGIMALLLALAWRLPRPWHLPAISVIFTAFWAYGALSLSALMIPENAGATWLWHEPFVELFWQPLLTPALFLAALTIVLWDATRARTPRPAR